MGRPLKMGKLPKEFLPEDADMEQPQIRKSLKQFIKDVKSECMAQEKRGEPEDIQKAIEKAKKA